MPSTDPTRALPSRHSDRLADIETRLDRFGGSPEPGPPRRDSSRPGLRLPRQLPPGLALLPVRLFLGVTFVYAGAQKLSDPGFLHPGAPTYIGTQLHQFAHGTPGGFILRIFAFPAPALAGVAVALVEIAVGLLTFFGLCTRKAAVVGLCLNLLLFLTNSWNAYPYFLGSDIVFVFAWLPLALSGAAGQPALDHYLAEAAVRGSARRPTQRPGTSLASRSAAASDELTRRALVARGLGATAVLTGLIAGIATLAKGTYRGTTAAKTLGGGSARSSHRASTQHHQTTSQGTQSHAQSASLPAGARDLGPASGLPPGQAAYYHDPATGGPDIVVRSSNGALSAHSAVCTHAGCTVDYSGGQLVCPCHGSLFNPTTGAVLQGPAVTPLPARRVVEQGGHIYAVPS